jgi:hypothetical protein
MANYNYGLNILTDLNKALYYQNTITVPATAQVTNFSPKYSISAVRIASFSAVGFDSFNVTSTLAATTLTADGTNSPYTTFNLVINNPNVPWGNVLDAVSVGVSSYGVALSAGVGAGTMTNALFTSAYELSSLGFWSSKAEHSRLYVNGEI